MKYLWLILPIMVLLAGVALTVSCNRSDDSLNPTTSVNPSAAATDEQVIPVTVNIIPHNPLNRINCRGKERVIAVAIEGTNTFDVDTVDHTTVVFGPEGATEVHIDDETELPVRHEYDFDDDGDKDLIFHFLYPETGLNCGSDGGWLEGYTNDGIKIKGWDFVDMYTRP